MFDEYPRPQLRRTSWINLCGEWDYAITGTPVFPGEWDGKITVPFSPEAPASGVRRLVRKKDYLWYRRECVFAPGSGRVLVHFGAADQRAVVWCNGTEVVSHQGGYGSFSADITDALLPDGRAELVVAVQDATESGGLARGKQKIKNGGIWYTPQSGLWQPVWAEYVPREYIRSLRITPMFEKSKVRIEAVPGGVVHFEGADYTCPAEITMESFIPWSPENPKLYSFIVTLGEDRVESYFAMRGVSVQNGRIFLNGKPYFMNGVLDQGYNPEGLLTYPSDEAMIADIQLAKSMGFNTLRKHVKTEPLRWYYHCDRLGMLVWQDMPNGGPSSYDLLLTKSPVLLGDAGVKDRNYRLFGRRNRIDRNHYYAELSALIEDHYNCPCIVMWVLFNEGWGQFDAPRARRLALSLDGTRLVDHASGWHDQGVGDLRSEHVYFRKYRYKPDKLGRAVILSEFGGYNLQIWGHTWNEKSFGYSTCIDAKDLETKLRNLYEREILPARQKGLSAAIYTQLTDVEEELNGFVTYDRQVVKIPPERVKRVVGV